jgi:hypothetical protein
MQQPSPWILFMGGIALLNVAMMIGGLHAPAWIRYAGMAGCAALGLFAMGIGLRKGFEKKPERPRFVPKRRKPAADPGASPRARTPETGKTR